MKALLPLFALVMLCTGCTSVSVRTAPGLDLTRFQRIFVLQPFNENHHLDAMMVDELRALGKEASSGPLTMMPENAELIVSYDARWTWDFKTYLIDLDVQVHTAHTKRKVAEGRYYQPSARPKKPEVAAQTMITRLFAPVPVTAKK